MIARTPQPQSNSEWFAKRPSPARTAAMWAAAKVAAGLQNLRGNRCDEGFGILMYHRIAERVRGVRSPTLNVTPEQLRHQLAGLLARGFESWPLSKLVAAQIESRRVPVNVFAVTFDDGYENNYVHAWPVLRELNIPGTIYLATKYLDTHQPFPFDDWPATGPMQTPPSAWRPLSTNQCREMLASGIIELGAHTHTHRKFVGRCGEFQRDMRLCLDLLRDRFGIICPTFAFPYGDLNSDLVEAARRLEISCAVTVRHRRVRSDDDLFQWGRFHVGPNDTPAMLAAKLSGWYPALAAAGKSLIRPFAKMTGAADSVSTTHPRTCTNPDVAVT